MIQGFEISTDGVQIATDVSTFDLLKPPLAPSQKVKKLLCFQRGPSKQNLVDKVNEHIEVMNNTSDPFERYRLSLRLEVLITVMTTILYEQFKFQNLPHILKDLEKYQQNPWFYEDEEGNVKTISSEEIKWVVQELETMEKYILDIVDEASDARISRIKSSPLEKHTPERQGEIFSNITF